MIKLISGVTIVVALVTFTLIRCGSSSSSSGTVTDSTTAMASVVNADPQSNDYTQTGVSSSTLSTQAGFSSTFYLKLTHADKAGSDTGTITMQQCMGDTPAQVIYLTMDVASDVYTGVVRFRKDSDSVDIDFTKKAGVGITDASFTADIDIKYNSEARLKMSANGSSDTNFLTGKKSTTAVACRWNSTLGCADTNTTDPVAFAISTNTSTGARTYTASSDTSLCTSLDFTTVEANETLGTAKTWDCALPSGKTWIEPALTAPQVEDAGGADCLVKNDFWKTTANPGNCGNPATAAGVGCLCDALYSIGTVSVRNATRMGICKMKGLYKLLKDGTASGYTLPKNDSVYIKLALTGGG